MNVHRKIERIWYGGAGGAALPLMHVFSLAYAGGLGARRALYRTGLKSAVDPGVPCISVGNIVVGGTGKTPMTAWLVRQLLGRQRKPAIVSRGYGGVTVRPSRVPPGGGPDECRRYGDEPVMLATAFPEVPVLVARDRSAAAKTAMKEFGADIVVADDAFQHWRLARTLDVVLVDGRRWFGNGRLLPGGPLREPPEALARADVVLLTRPEESGEKERIEELRRYAPRAVVAAADIVPARWRRHDGRKGEDAPAGPWFAFCGIADPEGFRMTLERLGEVAGWNAFPDHHRYGAGDAAALQQQAEESGAAAAVTTAKDAVRLPRWSSGIPLLVLEVTLLLRSGAEGVERLLDALPGKEDR